MKGHVPTLEELIHLSQGKIRLLIELKAVSEREKEPLVDQILASSKNMNFKKIVTLGLWIKNWDSL